MKRLYIALFVILLPVLASAQNYRIDWWVIASGGGSSQSSNYQLDGTIGQAIIGSSSSTNYTLESGFWVGFAEGGACDYVVGDINGNGQANGIDVTYGVAFLKGGNPPPIDCNPPCSSQPDPFYAAGDVNGNCAFNGIDITFFVAYLKGGPNPLTFCLDCPPAGASIPPASPAVMPILKSIGKPTRESNLN
jgi:hypothetical protein